MTDHTHRSKAIRHSIRAVLDLPDKKLEERDDRLRALRKTVEDAGLPASSRAAFDEFMKAIFGK